MSSRAIRQAKWYDYETKAKGGDVETDPLNAVVVKDGDPIISPQAARGERSPPTRCLLSDFAPRVALPADDSIMLPVRNFVRAPADTFGEQAGNRGDMTFANYV